MYILKLALVTFSNQGSFMCHTCCDTRPQLKRSRPGKPTSCITASVAQQNPSLLKGKTVNIKLSSAPCNCLKAMIRCYSCNFTFMIKKLGSRRLWPGNRKVYFSYGPDFISGISVGPCPLIYFTDFQVLLLFWDWLPFS